MTCGGRGSSSELYPSWQELRATISATSTKNSRLSRDIRFDTRVNEAEFDAAHNHWIVRSSDGSVASARYLVLRTGLVRSYTYRTCRAISDFAGELHHTAL